MTSAILPDDSQETVAARAIEVTKVYGQGQTEVRALDNLSVELPSGRFTAIMGPSGSGKSTLMHCLAGLDRITSGRIFIGDVELSKLSEKQLTLLRRDKVGFVFQSYNLLPTLTAAENVELPLAIAGRKPDRSWVDTVIDAVGLRERLTHKPAELSASSSGWPPRGRWPPSRRSCSPTSRPATSTRPPGPSCWASCAARWTTTARRS
jgi:ABC-type lipoprotein export system ATPase subunit